jgi:hypothetical protein
MLLSNPLQDFRVASTRSNSTSPCSRAESEDDSCCSCRSFARVAGRSAPRYPGTSDEVNEASSNEDGVGLRLQEPTPAARQSASSISEKRRPEALSGPQTRLGALLPLPRSPHLLSARARRWARRRVRTAASRVSKRGSRTDPYFYRNLHCRHSNSAASLRKSAILRNFTPVETSLSRPNSIDGPRSVPSDFTSSGGGNR